jgi:hypothetical protein
MKEAGGGQYDGTTKTCSCRKKRTSSTNLLFDILGIKIMTRVQAGSLGFKSQQCLGIFSPPHPDRFGGSTQSPIKHTEGALSLGVKRPGRGSDHSSRSSAKVKDEWSCTPTPPVRLNGAVLN